MRITMTTRKPLACGVGFFLWFILNYAWAGSDYKVSSVGTSTSQTGGFPGGSVFSGTLSIDGLPKNLPANSNLASYLTSFSFSDGAGHDYSNTSQNVVTFTGQTDANGVISGFSLSGSLTGGPPSFTLSPGPNGITSVPSSTQSAKWTGPKNLTPTAPPGPTPPSNVPASVNGCPIKHRAVCPNMNFSGLNLTGVNLSSAFLVNANFTGANLKNANLSGAQLSGAIFDNATMTNVNLQRADLGGASMNSATLDGANLSQANLKKANLTSSTLTKANLSKVMASETNFTGVNFTNASLYQIKARNANFTSGMIVFANLKSAYLAQAVFTSATLNNILVDKKTLLTGAILDTNGPITTQ